MDAFEEGYSFFEKNAGGIVGAELGEAYVGDVEAEIQKFAELLNEKFSNNHADINQLKGNLAEFWHAGTFNINAAAKGSTNRATVLESNKYGSVDVQLDSGTQIGSKYYKTTKATIKQQAKNARESYRDYQTKGGQSTFEEYMQERNITDPDAAVYTGQVRLVPKEQLEEIKRLHKVKIETEKSIRPEQVQRYQDTLKMIDDRIRDNSGVESVPLNTTEAKELAGLAKESGVSEEKLREMGISTEESIGFDAVIREAFKSGLTAATISMVLKVAPEIYKAISFLIQNGELDSEQFKKVGFAALSGAGEGFVKGTLSAALTTACKAGLLGQPLKSIDPSIIGAVTVIAMNTMKNAYYVVKGTKTKRDLADELVQEMFVTTCSLALGGVTQSFIQIPVLGFMIGSFVGSIIGSFAYKAGYNTILSFCVDTGFTMFGLVDQDYELPNEVMKIVGFEVFEFDTFKPEELEFDQFKFDSFNIEEFKPEELSISVLRRGVIGVSRIGYTSE